MLASDSDSELEYPEGANDSDASSDSGLKGKLALGIDPQEARSYDGRSAPTNGSQYLMMVMKETRTTPKIAHVDTSKLPKRKSQVAGNNTTSTMGQKDCSVTQGETSEVLSKIFPSVKWREDTVSSFSLVRNRIERWQYKIESGEILPVQTPKFPQSDENNQWWLKFCYGKAFTKLAASQKKKTAEEKLSDYFLDLYDETSVKAIMTDVDYAPTASLPETVSTESDLVGDSVETKSNSSGTSTDETAEIKSDDSVSQAVIGHRPVMTILMRLNQTQIENLIKWNLQWLNTIGLINECQGLWIYSLFASIPKPIDPSVMSDLRDIARYLIKIRQADCWISMMEQQKEPENEQLLDFINSLNLLIYVVSDYFQQKDLVMHL